MPVRIITIPFDSDKEIFIDEVLNGFFKQTNQQDEI